MIITKNNIPFDSYFEYIDGYVNFTNKLAEINNVQMLADKIKAAQDFNENSLVKIFADDLNLLLAVKATGGVSTKILAMINMLPSSQRFKEELSAILNAEKKEESSSAN